MSKDSLKFTGTARLCMFYKLFKPSNLSPRRKYPLVLFFHGSGERRADDKDDGNQLKYGVTRFTKPASQFRYPCFVLAPQCPKKLGDELTLWTVCENQEQKLFNLAAQVAIPLGTALELLICILNQFPVDTNRIYVTGLSMGGFATWEALMRHPRLFAAAIPVCGGGDFSHAIEIAGIPIWAFHGEDDSEVPVECSKLMIKLIEKAGGHPCYKPYPGVGHNCWDRAYSEPKLLSWLFSQNYLKRLKSVELPGRAVMGLCNTKGARC